MEVPYSLLATSCSTVAQHQPRGGGGSLLVSGQPARDRSASNDRRAAPGRGCASSPTARPPSVRRSASRQIRRAGRRVGHGASRLDKPPRLAIRPGRANSGAQHRRVASPSRTSLALILVLSPSLSFRSTSKHGAVGLAQFGRLTRTRANPLSLALYWL